MAVKRRDRTDQYVILSALYCLDAESVAVTTNQITGLLEQSLSKKELPSNVNASLNSYTGLVTVSSKGTPKKWSLSSEGLSRLRKLSGLELKTNKNFQEYESDIGIICALEFPEFDAVQKAFSETSWHDIDATNLTHIYRETKITTLKGQTLRVVGTTSTSMGLTAAAIATTQLILTQKPRIVVMVGIAAGTRSGGKQFGDILAADPSVDYNSGKVIANDGIREFQPDPYPVALNPRLRSVLHRYRGNHPIFEKIRAKWNSAHPAKATHLFVGPVGAADQVIDDAERIIEIQKNWRKLIGVEMETYGVYRAASEAPDPKPRFVSFKSVCDFAAEKTDSWQEYAAFTAAEFAFEFFRNEWDNLWPKK